MVKQGSVTLITPCYNGEKYLNTWFDCIMSQTYPHVKVFVVDDGSTDNSAEMLKSYEQKIVDKGYAFKYFYKENGGIASAIQVALKEVDTDYIYLYDQDDYLYEYAIEELADFLNSNLDYTMVRCNGYYTRDLPGNTEGKFYTDDELKEKEHIFTSLIKAEIVNWPASYMVRANVLFENLKNREIYISNYGQNMQIMLPVAYSGKCGYIDKPLMEYTIHDDSESHKGGYERQARMAEGYMGNRIEIVKSLDMTDSEKERYIKLAEDACALRKLELLYTCGKEEEYYHEYKRLKGERKIDRHTRLNYLKRRHKVLNFFARAQGKLVRILCKR